MASIDEAVALILPTKLPVLFVDPCILLDVIEATMRQYPHCVVSAVKLLQAVTAQPADCLVVVSSYVRDEWNFRSNKIRDAVRGHLFEMQGQSDAFHQACEVFGIQLPFQRAAYSAAVNVADRLLDLSKQLLDAAIVLDPDDATAGRGMRRVATNTPPARKGEEATDCVVLEEYLDVTRRLRALGYDAKLVFSTSNKADFCVGSRPHPNLAMDYAAIRLIFTTHLAAAVHELTS